MSHNPSGHTRRTLIGAATAAALGLAGCVRIDTVDNQADEVSVESGDIDVDARGSGGSDVDDLGSGEDEDTEDAEVEEGDDDTEVNGDSSQEVELVEYEIHKMGFTNVFNGVVENTTDGAIEGLTVSVVLFDEDGNEHDLENDASDSTSELPSGETWEFSITTVGVSMDDVSDHEFSFSTS